jgi:two-component system sensor histidine kinase BaeS
LYNSFQDITQLSGLELVEGSRSPILDYIVNEPVGSVQLYISRNFLNAESRRYLVDIIAKRLRQETLAAALAIGLALLFTRRVTGPLSALTRAIGNNSEAREVHGLKAGAAGEIRELAEAYNSLVRRLEEQRDMRRRLVADLSHDINNPLQAILLEARAITDGLVDPSEAAEGIVADVQFLKNLVYDLDWLAEVDAGEYSLETKPFDPGELLSEIAGAWSVRMHQAGKTLKLHKSGDLPGRIVADQARLSRALANLIENALRYNRSGSLVELRMETPGKFLRISVCDDGEAIPSGLRQRIFDRHFRGDESRSRAVPGSGLGLSIVRRIAELHGGVLRLECESGQGNCFIIEIPLGGERADA